MDSYSVNHSLATFCLRLSQGRPIVADRTLANAFPEHDLVEHIVEGQVSDTTGAGVGTWGTLVEAKRFMVREGLNTAILIGQAFHIGRIALQAKKLEINAVIPPELPKEFDKPSAQWWTRSRAQWVPREVVGSIVLRLKGQL